MADAARRASRDRPTEESSDEAVTDVRPPAPGGRGGGVTALVSGVSVFVNSYGVHAVSSPAVYTTAKNLVAAVVRLAAVAGVAWRAAAAAARPGATS